MSRFQDVTSLVRETPPVIIAAYPTHQDPDPPSVLRRLHLRVAEDICEVGKEEGELRAANIAGVRCVWSCQRDGVMEGGDD